MGPIFQAVGRPDILTKLSVARLIILVILIYPLSIRWGITGTSLAVLISALFTMPVTSYIVIKRILGSGVGIFLKTTILIPFITTMLTTLLLSFFTSKDVSLIEFAIAVFGGAAFYSMFTYSLDKVLNCGILNNLKSAVSGGLR